MRLKLVYALCCCTFLAQTLAPWKWMFLTLPFWGPNKMSNNDLLHQTYFSFLPLMADFHFLFVRWSFALECSLQCLLFRSLRRGFIHSLDVWNRWKVLAKNARTDFRWWSTTTSQVEQNRRLLSAWNFPEYCLARSCGEMLLSFFFGFTFNINLSIFKAKTWNGSCFSAE